MAESLPDPWIKLDWLRSRPSAEKDDVVDDDDNGNGKKVLEHRTLAVNTSKAKLGLVSGGSIFEIVLWCKHVALLLHSTGLRVQSFALLVNRESILRTL